MHGDRCLFAIWFLSNFIRYPHSAFRLMGTTHTDIYTCQHPRFILFCNVIMRMINRQSVYSCNRTRYKHKLHAHACGPYFSDELFVIICLKQKGFLVVILPKNNCLKFVTLPNPSLRAFEIIKLKIIRHFGMYE